MDHLPNRYAQFYQYVLELFPLWIVVYFFHMQNDLGVSLISLFCLAIVAYAVSTLVFEVRETVDCFRPDFGGWLGIFVRLSFFAGVIHGRCFIRSD